MVGLLRVPPAPLTPAFGFPINNVGNDSVRNVGNDSVRNGGNDKRDQAGMTV